MIGKKFFKIISVYFFFSCTLLVLPALKNTEQSADEVTYASQFYLTKGAILWETEWLSNFYSFANFYPLESFDKRNRKVIGCDPSKSSALIQLLYILFYRVPNSTSFTDFNSTVHIKASTPQDASKVATSIAQMLVNLENLRINMPRLHSTINTLTTETQKVIENLPSGNVNLLPLNNFVKALNNYDLKKIEHSGTALLLSSKSIFKESSAPTLSDLFGEYKKIIELLKEWQTACEALFKFSYLKSSFYRFSLSTAQALEECTDTSNGYPDDLVYSIFLAFLYKTLNNLCPTDTTAYQEALKSYYTTLQAHKITLQPLPSEKVPSPSLGSDKESLEKFLSILENISANNNSLAKALEYMTGSKRYLLPESYRTIKYLIPNSTSSTPPFSDCMENSLANFFRTLSYNPHTRNYSLESLENNLEIKLSDKSKTLLKDFFKNVINHEYWAGLVTNLYYTPYLHAIPKTTSQFLPYLKVGEINNLNKINSGNYRFLEGASSLAYELWPSVRTVMMVIAHLFALEVWENSLETEFHRKDFVEYYLPKIFSSLNMTARIHDTLLLNEDAVALVIQDTVEKNPTEQVKHIFTLHEGKHGQYTLEFLGKENISEKNFKEYSANIKSLDNTTGFYYKLLLLNRFPQQALTTDLEITKECYTLPLNNADYSYSFIKKFLDYSFASSFNTLFLLKLIGNEPDIERRVYLLKDFLEIQPLQQDLSYIHTDLIAALMYVPAYTNSLGLAEKIILQQNLSTNTLLTEKLFKKLEENSSSTTPISEILVLLAQKEESIKILLRDFIGNALGDTKFVVQNDDRIMNLITLCLFYGIFSDQEVLTLITHPPSHNKLLFSTSLLSVLNHLLDSATLDSKEKESLATLEKILNQYLYNFTVTLPFEGWILVDTLNLLLRLKIQLPENMLGPLFKKWYQNIKGLEDTAPLMDIQSIAPELLTLFEKVLLITPDATKPTIEGIIDLIVLLNYMVDNLTLTPTLLENLITKYENFSNKDPYKEAELKSFKAY